MSAPPITSTRAGATSRRTSTRFVISRELPRPDWSSRGREHKFGFRSFQQEGADVTSPSKSKKRQKSERDLERHYGAVRIKSVAGVLEHHRNRDTPSREATKPSKPKRSVLEDIGRPLRSQKSKGPVVK
jgi:hypothetical protein